MRFTAAICILLMFVGVFTGCTARECAGLPERLTLYLTGERRIITLTREEYLTGCILACTDPSFQPEALKAAAAACCGHALSVMNERSPAEFMGADLSDDPGRCPAWTSPEEALEDYCAGQESTSRKLTAAVEYAAALCPEYDGAPAYTPVFRCSTGITDDGGLPWLPSLELPEDSACPWYSSTCTVPAEYARKALREYTGSVVLPPSPGDWFTDPEYTHGGVLLTVRFGDSEVTGEQLRQAFGLRSSAVTITVSREEMTFTSRGCGGNTGMSAYSAERLARGGMSAEEIFAYFFPGVAL